MKNTDKINKLVEVEVVRPDIDTVVAKHGVTVDDFVKCMKEGLVATRAIKDRDGDVVEEVADWNVRHKFFATGLELLGYLRGSGTTVNVGVTAEEKEVEEMFKEWRSGGKG